MYLVLPKPKKNTTKLDQWDGLAGKSICIASLITWSHISTEGDKLLNKVLWPPHMGYGMCALVIACSIFHVLILCAVKKYHDHVPLLYKRKHSLRWQLTDSGSLHYHHGREHVSTKVDVVLEESLRVLQLAGNEKSTESHTEGNLSPPLQWDTLPPAIPHLLIVPPSLGTIFFWTPQHHIFNFFSHLNITLILLYNTSDRSNLLHLTNYLLLVNSSHSDRCLSDNVGCGRRGRRKDI